MRRRTFLSGLAAMGALTACSAAPTTGTRPIRLGALTSERVPPDGTAPQLALDIMEGLAAEGFTEGRNMTIEWLHTQGDRSLFPLYARRLVAMPVDILITSAAAATLAAKDATRSIPIVMQGVGEARDYGVVENYAHPGGNVTGITFDATGEAIKRLELLHEAFPKIRIVTVVGIDPESPATRLPRLMEAGQTIGMSVRGPVLTSDDDLTRALEAVPDSGGVVVVGTSLIFQNIPRLARYGAERRVPVIFSRPEDVSDTGGLMSYGANRREMRVGVGKFVRRIVEGTRPGDIPVELPSKYDLVVNLATAERLGVTVPTSVLARATVVR